MPLRRLLVVLVCLWPLVSAAVAPPVVFRVEDPAGVAVARLCERVWAEYGEALAADILPAGAVADTVHCLVLPTARFEYFFADRLPDWGVGVALPPGRLVAVDHERLPSVGPGPETVFLHEMTHALLFQAAGEARLPTWLHEGAAMRASGQWRVTDTLGVILDGHLPSLNRLDGAFPQGAAAAQRAYRTSLLAVNWLEREHGPQAVRRIVAAARRAGDFRQGFTDATGETPDRFASRFAGAMRLRYGWVLLLFRWPTLFVVMALVLLIGGGRKLVLRRRAMLADEDDLDI